MTSTFTRFGVRFVRKICNAFGEHGAGLIDSMTKSLRFNVGLSLSTSRFSFFFFSFFNSYNLMRKKIILKIVCMWLFLTFLTFFFLFLFLGPQKKCKKGIQGVAVEKKKKIKRKSLRNIRLQL